MFKKNKRIIIVVIIVVVVLLLSFPTIKKSYAKRLETQAQALEKQKRQGELDALKKIENAANERFERVIREVNNWRSEDSWIVEEIDNIINQYPETETAKKIIEYKEVYKNIRKKVLDEHEEQERIKQAEVVKSHEEWLNNLENKEKENNEIFNIYVVNIIKQYKYGTVKSEVIQKEGVDSRILYREKC